ncbi:MAG: hypothetical protein NC484_02255 [Alloprevotella sp.]|nr:hypothetical protein [Alloprevotella sp.]
MPKAPQPATPGPPNPTIPTTPAGLHTPATLPRHDPSDPHRDRWPEAIHCDITGGCGEAATAAHPATPGPAHPATPAHPTPTATDGRRPSTAT